MLTTTLSLYLACGAAAGFLAGLLGIGGGLVVVPLLDLLFTLNGSAPDELSPRLAMGASLSSVVFTAASSVLAHARRGLVNWPLVRRLAPAAAAGALLGAAAASFLPAFGLRLFFACFLAAAAAQMLADLYPPPRGAPPSRAALAGGGLLIGALSGLAGLAGGAMSVPFLLWYGLDMRRAVGSSAAVGWVVAAAGSLGFIYNGWQTPNLPPHCLGYISLPATLGVAAAGVFFAPLGARLSQALPVKTLRRIFGFLLCLMAVRQIWRLFG